MHAHRIVTLVFFLGACVGPPAPDAAVCQDVISRLCARPVCSATETQLDVGDACAATLLARTGCADEAFTFSNPSRDRVLECRAPLLRDGARAGEPVPCHAVSQALSSCPDLVFFLAEGAP